MLYEQEGSRQYSRSLSELLPDSAPELDTVDFDLGRGLCEDAEVSKDPELEETRFFVRGTEDWGGELM